MAAAHLIKFDASKTYATRANAIKAVEKVCGPNHEHFGSADIRYLVVQGDDGRWFPVFIGESALRHGAHFQFCVAA
jgi:hypothetical protein